MIADRTAELALVGSLLLDPMAIFTALATGVSPADFTDARARMMFNAQVEVSRQDRTVDVVAVAGFLDDAGDLQHVGGVPGVMSFTDHVATAANVDHYAERIREKARLRSAVDVAAAIVKDAEHATNPGSFLAQAQEAIVSLTNGPGAVPVESAAAWSSAYYRELEDQHEKNEPPGIQTSLHVFDSRGGLKRGSMYVVAGRPGMGKTAFALSMACEMCELGASGFMGSFEMKRRELADRIAANKADIDYSVIQDARRIDADEWTRIAKVMGQISERYTFDLWCAPGTTFDALRLRVLQSHARKPLDFAIFDYLQLIDGPGDSLYERTTNVSVRVKRLAGEINAPILLLAQLNRGVESRDNKRPRMSDLRDSGGVEQDADGIALLYRDVVYNDNADPNAAEVIIGKYRHGHLGTAHMRFDGSRQRFQD